MLAFQEQKTYALFSNPANRKLAAGLEQKDFKVFRFEPVEIERISDARNSEIIRNNLSEFDWIIFPDIFAVVYFLEIFEESEIDLFELDAIRVLACGEAVADRLRFVQLHADVIPHSVETDTIFQTLSNYLGTEDLSGLKFLISQEAGFDSELKNKLAASQACITEIAVYKIAKKTNTTNLKALLKGGAIDEFIFSSPEEIISLKHYLFDENLSEIFRETTVSATDEVTFQALRENNLRPRFFHIK